MVTPTIIPAGYGTATVKFIGKNPTLGYNRYQVEAFPAQGKRFIRTNVNTIFRYKDGEEYPYSFSIRNGEYFDADSPTEEFDTQFAFIDVESIKVYFEDDPDWGYELNASASVSPNDAALAGADATATPSHSVGSKFGTVSVSYDATDGNGWEFEKWSDGSTDRTHTVSYILGPDRVKNVSLVAIFKYTGSHETYYIHASASISPSTAGDVGCSANAEPSLSSGQLGGSATVTYTASAASGWRFISWSDGSEDASHQVTYEFGPDEHKYVSLVAIFEEEKKLYNVNTVIIPEKARGTSSGDGSYEAETEVTVDVHQKCNLWIFDRWEFSTGDTYYEKSVTFIVSEDVTCTAYFRHENTGELIFDADGSGDLIMGDGGSLLYNGDLVTA